MNTDRVVALLNLLHQERAIAISRWEHRRWDADHGALRRAKVDARLRYRSFANAAMASFLRGDIA